MDKISDQLITEFRELVNANSSFVYQTYHNVDGKNYWNVICSCMDWISVAIRFIQNMPKFDNDIDVKVMQTFTYISSIDIIYESIIQLHRIIIRNNSLPFKDEKTIFDLENTYRDDNEYFKELRAIFGAHPVNLKNKTGRWYASWPSNYVVHNDHDLEVNLYSNQINVTDVIFGISLNELNEFLRSRYNYLLVLKDAIQKDFQDYKERFKRKKIESVKNVVAQLKILGFEAKERLNNDYYVETINKLFRIFNSTIDDPQIQPLEKQYKEQLRLVILEIKEKLQKMDFTDLKFDHLLNPAYSYSDLGYVISKLYNCDFILNRNPLFDFYLKKLNNHSKNKYNFNNSDSPDVLFLKLKIMLYNDENVV